jgi:hypothetical protein
MSRAYRQASLPTVAADELRRAQPPLATSTPLARAQRMTAATLGCCQSLEFADLGIDPRYDPLRYGGCRLRWRGIGQETWLIRDRTGDQEGTGQAGLWPRGRRRDFTGAWPAAGTQDRRMMMAGSRIGESLLTSLGNIEVQLVAGHGAVPKASVSCLPSGGHLREHRLLLIDIVVDDHIALCCMEPM